MIRIALIGAGKQLRSALKLSLCLQRDFQIVGDTDIPKEASAVCARFAPDVVIINIFPPFDTVAALKQFRRNSPCSKFILLGEPLNITSEWRLEANNYSVLNHMFTLEDLFSVIRENNIFKAKVG